VKTSRVGGEIRGVGQTGMKTAGDLKKNLSDSGVSCGSIASDDWDSFAAPHLRVETIAQKRNIP
jgi:hypothetical protein